MRIKIGDKVDYHATIGGEITSYNHEVTWIGRKPNNFGCDVAKISGKAGVVALKALTRAQKFPCLFDYSFSEGDVPDQALAD